MVIKCSGALGRLALMGLTLISMKAMGQATFFATQSDFLYRFPAAGPVQSFVLTDSIVGMTTVPNGLSVGNLNGGATGGSIIAVSSSINNKVYRIDNPMSSNPTLMHIGNISDMGASPVFVGNRLFSIGSDPNLGVAIVEWALSDFSEQSRTATGVSSGAGGMVHMGGLNFLYTEFQSDLLYSNFHPSTSSMSIGSVPLHDYSGLEMYQGQIYSTFSLSAGQPNGGNLIFGTLNASTGAYTHYLTLDTFRGGVTGLTVVEAVPEPSSLLAGLIGLAGLARRRLGGAKKMNKHHHHRNIAVLVIAATSVSAYSQPIGDWYGTVSNFNGDRMARVSGGTVSYGTLSRPFEGPIAVAGDVRTISVFPTSSGGQYDLNMNYLGVSYSFPTLPSIGRDGTTDGTWNYTVDVNSGTVYRLDRNWANSVPLFGIGSSSMGGITYSPLFGGTLYVSGSLGSGTVGQYDLSGTLIGSYFFGGTLLNLACDVDNTIWSHRGTSLDHFSSTGTSLGSFGLNLGPNDYIHGGEINVVPEPGSLLAIGVGLVALARRRLSAAKKSVSKIGVQNVATLTLASVSVAANSQPIGDWYGTVFGTSGDQLARVSGGVLSFGTPMFPDEGPIAVSGDVRTLSVSSGGVGSQYDLNLGFLGTNYTFPSIPGVVLDGTTDGSWNYTVDIIDGTVYRLDRNWANPSAIVFHGSAVMGGITYSPLFGGTLYVAGQNGSGIVNQYTLSGTMIASYVFGGDLSNLACDVDTTIWSHRGAALDHFLPNGVPIGSFGLSFGPGGFVRGAEITPVPEPGTMAAMGLGLLTLRRRAKRMSLRARASSHSAPIRTPGNRSFRMMRAASVTLFAAFASQGFGQYKGYVLHPTGNKDSALTKANNGVQIGSSTLATGNSPNPGRWTGTPNSFIDMNLAVFSGTYLKDISGPQIVGFAQLNGGVQYPTHALMWTNYSTLTSLHPSGLFASEANGTDGSSQVGRVRAFNGSWHASLWNGTSTHTNLNPVGYFTSNAVDVSGGNQVGYGSGPASSFEDHALLWNGNSAATDLNPVGYEYSWALGIDGNSIVGWGGGPSIGFQHALLWNGTASYVDLHPVGYWRSSANDVSGGLQVGYGTTTSTSADHALLWSGTSSALDLHALLPAGYVASTAGGIDKITGEIVGAARRADGSTVAVIWSPVPEPATLAMVSMGAVGLLRRRRRPTSS